jgi:hypothetical protein
MIDKTQFLAHVVRPALKFLEPQVRATRAAEQLLVGTALQESNLTYLKQLGGGPALGLFQMEPTTHDDIWDNFLAYKAPIRVKMIGKFGPQDSARLVADLLYAACMCRLHYYRRPEALPRTDDVHGQAEYWKAHYNTRLGHGTVDQYKRNWKKNAASHLWPASSGAT